MRGARIRSRRTQVVAPEPYLLCVPPFLIPSFPKTYPSSFFFFLSLVLLWSRNPRIQRTCIYIWRKPLLYIATIHRWPSLFVTVRSGIAFSSYDFYLQAIFASSIPEIIELVGSRSKYSGEYKREHGKRYYYIITSFNPVFFCLLTLFFYFQYVYILD